MQDIIKPTKSAAVTTTSKRVETFKTIVITVLVTAILGFLAGMHVANQTNAAKQTAVKNAVSQLK